MKIKFKMGVPMVLTVGVVRQLIERDFGATHPGDTAQMVCPVCGASRGDAYSPCFHDATSLQKCAAGNPMQKFRKKPVEIKAAQYDVEPHEECPDCRGSGCREVAR